MKLKQFSIGFSLAVILALCANAIFLLMIQKAHDSVVVAQEHRQQAMSLANELRQETELLTRLVRAYTSTGEPSYLMYYYDILAIREGTKPKPENYVSEAYWDRVIAGEISHHFPENGVGFSYLARMRSLGFSNEEFTALDKVYAATETIKQVEQIAFAATQGLYDIESSDFVSDGKPNLDFARELVYSQKYNQLKADLAKVVFSLVELVDNRTNTAMTQAAKQLELWILLTFASMFCSVLLVLAASQVIRRQVLQPIDKLWKAAGQLGKGDYSIRTIRPQAVQNQVAQTGVEELTRLSLTFDSMAESIERDIQFRQKTQQALEVANQKAENAILGLKCLLDNAEQGFLTFGADLLIDNQFSLACTNMFGVSPAGKNAAELFFHNDAVKAELLRDVIALALIEGDQDIQDSMLSLLPAEIQNETALLKVAYKILENSKIMAVLTDISEERQLELLLDKERRRLEMIVMAVTENSNFFDTLDSFRDFVEHRLPNLLHDATEPNKLAFTLYREIHTYKGLLNQFSFTHTPHVLHALETQLSESLNDQENLTQQTLVEMFTPSILQAPFAEDLDVVTLALGDDFLTRGESISLSREQTLQLQNLATQLLQGNPLDIADKRIHSLLNELCILGKISLQKYLMSFDVLLNQAAKRTQKQVNTLLVEANTDIWLDPYIYRPFLRTLIHVFRNAVVHGLELPMLRIDAGKAEAGQILCRIQLEEKLFKLWISDDGSGIDLDALREQLKSSGIYATAELNNFADTELIQCIFMDNFSTQHEVTELAGRGVGLASVKAETLRLGGKIDVNTVTGQGTEFLFTLPLIENLQTHGG